jgi:hypothetical protein
VDAKYANAPALGSAKTAQSWRFLGGSKVSTFVESFSSAGAETRQISGRNDATYASHVALNKYYVHNWSPWLELHILARTVHAVIRADDAY